MPATPRLAAVPDGQRLYAIGDIHGRADLLSTMADMIADDLRSRPIHTALTVCVGDYVDRGSDSAAVIDRLSEGRFPTPLVALRGNHEDVFLAFLEGEAAFDHYESLGGGATLRSYGLDLDDLAWMNREERHRRLRDGIPARHRAFIEATPLCFTSGDYFFCHAGVRPDVPLALQADEDLLWIRRPFLDSTSDFGKTVVHGHTPVPAPDIRAHRINIDTKAYASGILTAAVLEGTDRHFLQTRPQITMSSDRTDPQR